MPPTIPGPRSAFQPLQQRQPGAFAPVFSSPHNGGAGLAAPFAPLGRGPVGVPPPAPQPDRRRTTFIAATVGLLSAYRSVDPSFNFVDNVPRRCLTQPSEVVGGEGAVDNVMNDYVLHVNDVLHDADGGDEYIVLDMLGTGTFGQVAKCFHRKSRSVVAVKIVKNQPAYFNQAWVEISILRMLHSRMSAEEKMHVVEYRRHFVLHGHLCIVFEKLSINLFELLRQNRYTGVNMGMLRSFLRQLLHALALLVKTDIIHCDVKPENILLTSQVDISDLKLIDFGSACQVQHHVYSYVQSRFYRSPEVLLRASNYDTKIDMWSLGCVAGELFLGVPLFAGQSAMNMLCRIDEMLGPFPDMFLRSCRATTKYFNYGCAASGNEMDTSDFAAFRLKTVAEFENENSVQLDEWKRYFKDRRLRDVVLNATSRASSDEDDTALRESFLDLLQGMLKIDPAERWTPEEALAHPFVTEGPLPGGVPWVPRSRAHNIRHQPTATPRARPAVIDPHGHAPMSDIMYSASAPSYVAAGPFAQNHQHNVQPHQSQFQMYHQHHHHGPSTPQHQQAQQGGSAFTGLGHGAGMPVGDTAHGGSQNFSSFNHNAAAPRSFVQASAFPACHHAHSFSGSSSVEAPHRVQSQSPAPFGAEGATHPTVHSRIHGAAPVGVPSSGGSSRLQDSSPDIAAMSSTMSTHVDTDTFGPGTWSDNDDALTAPATPGEGAPVQSPFSTMGSSARPPLHTSPRLHAQQQTGHPK